MNSVPLTLTLKTLSKHCLGDRFNRGVEFADTRAGEENIHPGLCSAFHLREQTIEIRETAGVALHPNHVLADPSWTA